MDVYHSKTAIAPRSAKDSAAVTDVTLAERPAPLLEPFEVPVLVGVTDATEPMVADGTARSPPLIDIDSEDRVAKPTDAGDDL